MVACIARIGPGRYLVDVQVAIIVRVQALDETESPRISTRIRPVPTIVVDQASTSGGNVAEFTIVYARANYARVLGASLAEVRVAGCADLWLGSPNQADCDH